MFLLSITRPHPLKSCICMTVLGIFSMFKCTVITWHNIKSISLQSLFIQCYFLTRNKTICVCVFFFRGHNLSNTFDHKVKVPFCQQLSDILKATLKLKKRWVKSSNTPMICGKTKFMSSSLFGAVCAREWGGGTLVGKPLWTNRYVCSFW